MLCTANLKKFWKISVLKYSLICFRCYFLHFLVSQFYLHALSNVAYGSGQWPVAATPSSSLPPSVLANLCSQKFYVWNLPGHPSSQLFQKLDLSSFKNWCWEHHQSGWLPTYGCTECVKYSMSIIGRHIGHYYQMFNLYTEKLSLSGT